MKSVLKKFSLFFALAFALPLMAQQSTSLALLTNASATGTALLWPGGQGVFVAVGTFNGATVTLQFLGPDGATYLPAGTATTLTANGAGVFYLPRLQIRAAITGGGVGTSITATAAIVPVYIGG